MRDGHSRALGCLAPLALCCCPTGAPLVLKFGWGRVGRLSAGSGPDGRVRAGRVESGADGRIADRATCKCECSGGLRLSIWTEGSIGEAGSLFVSFHISMVWVARWLGVFLAPMATRVL